METVSRPNPGIGRRGFLRTVGAAALTAAATSSFDGFLIEPHLIKRPRLDIGIDALPKAFEGYRILHITDIHMGTPGAAGRMEDLPPICAETACDAIVFTGDFVSTRASIPALAEGLRRIRRPPDGFFAVLGNHDHWMDAGGVLKALDRSGVEVLTNRGRKIERGGDVLWICGTGDLWEDRVDVDQAIADAPDGCPRVLLSHNPDAAETEVLDRHRIDLQLSGHTHGGQVKIPFGPSPLVPSAYGQKYVAGLVKAPHTRVFVSKGVGLISPPVRFNCRPEAPVIRLIASEISKPKAAA